MNDGRPYSDLERSMEVQISKEVEDIIRNTHDLGDRQIKVISEISIEDGAPFILDGQEFLAHVFLRIRNGAINSDEPKMEIVRFSANLHQGENYKYAEIKRFGINPHMQGIGLGSSFLNSFHRMLKEQGYPYVIVCPGGSYIPDSYAEVL